MNMENFKNPAVIYGITKLAASGMVILIVLLSFPGLIVILQSLFKGSNSGSGTYLFAALFTLFLDIALLLAAFKVFIPDVINKVWEMELKPLKYEDDESQFDDYEKVELGLRQGQIPHYQSGVRETVKRDEAYIIKFFIFLAATILFLLANRFVPNNILWDIGFTMDDFSFPWLFMLLLAAVTALRWASGHFHNRAETGAAHVTDDQISVKGKGNLFTLETRIKEALESMWKTEHPPIVVRSGFTETEGKFTNLGKIEKKFFIESPPSPVRYVPHSIAYLYLAAAVVLFIIGALMLIRYPPDNISVLSVPIIALSHFWTVVQGAILFYSGWDLIKSIQPISVTHWFESTLVCVLLEGSYGKESLSDDMSSADTRTIIRSDLKLKIYTTRLLTECYRKKRHIIRMVEEKGTQKAARAIIKEIENFEKESSHENQKESGHDQ